MSSIVSNEDCLKTLKSYLKSSNGIKIISSECKSISDDVEGFLGEHYKLIIKYEDKGVQRSSKFFVKNKPIKNKAQCDLTEALGVYKKEIFVYDILIPEFEKYGYDTSFAAKSYHSIPEEALIMEDITLNGFSLTQRGIDLTLQHLKCALKSLALYHAGGYALERTKTKELNKRFCLGDEYSDYNNEIFFIQYIDQNMYAMKWWKSCLKTLDVLINLIPNDEAYKTEFKKLVKNAEIGKYFASDAKSKINKTCGHGDLWSNNLLFKYEKNIPVKCCLVDFQICRYFYPSLDVILVIFCNTNANFRKLHLEELYLYYHKNLSEILQNYGYNIEDIYSLRDFYDSIDLVKVEALMQNFLTVVVTLLPKNQLNDVAENEAAVQELLFDNDELAAKSFENDVIYRTTILEVLSELREALLKRNQKQ